MKEQGGTYVIMTFLILIKEKPSQMDESIEDERFCRTKWPIFPILFLEDKFIAKWVLFF